MTLCVCDPPVEKKMAPTERKTIIKMLRVTTVVLILILAHPKSVECDQQCSYRKSLTNGARFQIDDRFFTASSSYPRYPPEDARHLTDPETCWCSDNLQVNSVKDLRNNGREGPWLKVQFGADVIIRNIYVSGFAGPFFSWYFVEKFQIYYGRVGEELTPITTVRLNGQVGVKNFTARDPFTKALRLGGPIVTQVLQFVPLEWNNKFACMSIEAQGCLTGEPTCDVNQLVSTGSNSLSPPEITQGETTTVEDFELINLIDNKGDYDQFAYFPWCFETNFDDNPYVQLEFEKPIWLTHMMTRRHPLRSISLSRGYITNISLHYMDESTNSFREYSDLFGNHIFAKDGIEFRTFWEPLASSVFIFNMNAGVAGPGIVDPNVEMYCWNILLHGCTVGQEEAPGAMSKGQVNNAGSTNTVQIMMPVGIVIGCVLVLTILSILVILIVVSIKKQKKRSQKDDENGTTTSSDRRQQRSRRLTTTVMESIAYTWRRTKSKSRLNAPVQSEQELQTPETLREPLLELISEESTGSELQ